MLAFFFSIMVYDLYISIPVIKTNTGLYLVKFAKYADPTDPRPRDANIRPPLQHKDAAIAVNIEPAPSNFSFTKTPPIPLGGLMRF